MNEDDFAAPIGGRGGIACPTKRIFLLARSISVLNVLNRLASGFAIGEYNIRSPYSKDPFSFHSGFLHYGHQRVELSYLPSSFG